MAIEKADLMRYVTSKMNFVNSTNDAQAYIHFSANIADPDI
jgi:hypothetical protein